MRLIAVLVSIAVCTALLLGLNNGHCTLWFDRLLLWDWSACCAAHDNDYAIGIVKVIADYFLRTCANAALPGMGEVMWVGLCVLFGWASNWFYRRGKHSHQA